MIMKLFIKVIIIGGISVLVSCTFETPKKIKPTPVPVIVDGRPEHQAPDVSNIANAVPRYEHWSPTVNPSSYRVLGKEYYVLASNKGYQQQGIASWYGTKFHNKKTATGEDYDMYAMTAAHKTLPIPSYARVTNLDNQRSIVVKINDRGPFHEQRIIDLSYVAAIKLGIEQSGTGRVEVTALQAPVNALASSPDEAHRKRVYLQVGAFKNQNNAFKLQHKIAGELALSTRHVRVHKIDNSLFYRVQVGPILSIDEADSMTEKLKRIAIRSTQFISQ